MFNLSFWHLRILIITFQQLPAHVRAEAMDSLNFEAQCRIEDPVYGCVGIISLLQKQIQKAETQLAKMQAEIAVYSSYFAHFDNFSPIPFSIINTSKLTYWLTQAGFRSCLNNI